MDKENLKKNFWTNGYAVIRSVYSQDQILRFRNFIKKEGQEIVSNTSQSGARYA